MTMITPSYLGETIEYSSLHACRSTLEDPTIDCSTEFVFTVGEQLFFLGKDFKHDPRRCKTCKAKRSGLGRWVRPETRTVCSMCGSDATVPFKPTQGGPVLCRSCFRTQVTAQHDSESGASVTPTLNPH